MRWLWIVGLVGCRTVVVQAPEATESFEADAAVPALVEGAQDAEPVEMQAAPEGDAPEEEDSTFETEGDVAEEEDSTFEPEPTEDAGTPAPDAAVPEPDAGPIGPAPCETDDDCGGTEYICDRILQVCVGEPTEFCQPCKWGCEAVGPDAECVTYSPFGDGAIQDRACLQVCNDANECDELFTDDHTRDAWCRAIPLPGPEQGPTTEQTYCNHTQRNVCFQGARDANGIQRIRWPS